MKSLLLLFSLLCSSFAQMQYALYPAPLGVSDCLVRSDNAMIFYDVIRSGSSVQRGTGSISGIYDGSFPMRIGGMWTPDATGTSVQRSAKNAVLSLVQDFEKYKTPVKTHFIKVKSVGGYWSNYISDNIATINAYIGQGLRYGFDMGIYTSAKDWEIITGNTTNLIAKVSLWYINDNGQLNGSPANFDDFVPFGPFTKANVVMKQYSTMENYCQNYISRSVFSIS